MRIRPVLHDATGRALPFVSFPIPRYSITPANSTAALSVIAPRLTRSRDSNRTFADEECGCWRPVSQKGSMALTDFFRVMIVRWQHVD
eukprot:3172510-Rhodomonas_salina.1